jgi:hypothetical protein
LKKRKKNKVSIISAFSSSSQSRSFLSSTMNACKKATMQKEKKLNHFVKNEVDLKVHWLMMVEMDELNYSEF